MRGFEGECEASKFDRDRSLFDREQSLLSADLFSELGRPDLSIKIINIHLESIPDTIEKRPHTPVIGVDDARLQPR